MTLRCRSAGWRAATAVLLTFALGACRAHPPDPHCVRMLAVLDRCDPGARQMPGVYRQRLMRSCPALKACAGVDTSTPAGCARFEGCLYDGP